MADLSPRRSLRLKIALVLLLASAFALRAWYASYSLRGGRFFDERFSLRNVAAHLVHHTTVPENAYYPSLAHLPQTAVLAVTELAHRATGIEALAVFDEGSADGFSKTAYLLCRLTAALFGLWSLWLTFRLGEKLFSPAVGLLGATFLSALWAHVQSSSMFKPDILVVVLTLLTFLWTLRAAEKPTLRAFLWVGLGVGLTASAKHLGVGAALPIAAFGLVTGWRDRRRFLWLAAAGALSALVFLALNPYLYLVQDYLGRQWEIYESKARIDGGSHLYVFVEQARFLWSHHQPPVLLAALGGLVGLGLVFVRGEGAGRASSTELPGSAGGPSRLAAGLVLTYVVGYSLFYAGLTEAFRSQNYLPVTAFTALAAAWFLVGAWRWLASRVPALGSPVLATLVASVLLAGLFWRPVDLVYHEVVPSTHRRAAWYLTSRLQPLEHRYLIYQGYVKEFLPRRGAHRLPAVPVEQLLAVSQKERDYADAELFPADLLEGPEGEELLRRLADRRGLAERIDGTFPRTHGPPLVALLHPWDVSAGPAPLEVEGLDERSFRLSLSPEDYPRGEGPVSLSVWLRHQGRPPSRPIGVELAGRWVPLYLTGTVEGRVHYGTPRFDLPAEPAPGAELTWSFVLDQKVPLVEEPEISLRRWRPRQANRQPGG